MPIIIPYTKYVFQPPDSLPPDMVVLMKTQSLSEFRETLDSANRSDLQAFVARTPKTHWTAMWFITAFSFCLLYYGVIGVLYVIAGQLPDWVTWENSTHRLFVILSGICFFAIFLFFRSHLESYSSFQGYLNKKKKFFLKAKKQLDRTAPRTTNTDSR